MSDPDNAPAVDLTQALALMTAYLDDDGPAIDAIIATTEAGVLAPQLFWLALHLGRQAARLPEHLRGPATEADNDRLRDALRDALVREVTH